MADKNFLLHRVANEERTALLPEPATPRMLVTVEEV